MFRGCYTAIVTPFKESGVRSPVDWEGFKELIDFQDESGVAGIVACGSTGESATLSIEEHNEVISFVAEHSTGQTIGGTGSNSTWEAIEMTRHAEDVGAAASLQVCPYYNKPNQEGLYRHFAAVAEAVDIPIILYNVPSRTVREIEPSTMARLAREYSNIVGVKEASGREEVWQAIRRECPDDFIILSGNDEDTFRLMRDYGATGVISVASNLLAKELADFVGLGLSGRFDEMEREHERLSEVFKAFFIDTNPIPIKQALNSRGFRAGGYRLPLCEMTEEKKRELEEVLGRVLG
ncbi:MAG: 4-hydroxy-tetrahydrodipicolinate synthase [Methanobacteriota archaeon]|nr:MAG: 4-hydroxy-tetrahydrodipicolinate synthase [Euryarchaeota archaeon]